MSAGGGVGELLDREAQHVPSFTQISVVGFSLISQSQLICTQSPGRNCHIKSLGFSNDLLVVKYQAVPNNKYLGSDQGEIAFESNREILSDWNKQIKRQV